MVIVESISYVKEVMVRVMVFNATFNNTSVKSWQSVLLAEETGVPGENHRHAVNKGNNKITEHRAIFQRERQNS
jgi:hypothetical protein